MTLGYQHVMIEKLEPHPDNPRKSFDESKLQELADSIRERGVLEPILAVPHPDDPDRYRIVCGERRYRATKLAGKGTIPCVVREMDRREQLEAMIIENLQRVDVDPVEEARGLRVLIEEGMTQEQVAATIGKSQAYVANRLRLLKLPDDALAIITREMIPAATALALVKAVRWPEACVAAAKELAERGATSREAPEIVDDVLAKMSRPLTVGYHEGVGFIEPEVAEAMQKRLEGHPDRVEIKRAWADEPVPRVMDHETWKRVYDEAKAEVEAAQAEAAEKLDSEQERLRAEREAEWERQRRERELAEIRMLEIKKAVVNTLGHELDVAELWAAVLVGSAGYDKSRVQRLYKMAGVETPAELEQKHTHMWEVRKEDTPAIVEALSTRPIGHLRQLWLKWELTSQRYSAVLEALYGMLPDAARADVDRVCEDARGEATGSGETGDCVAVGAETGVA